MSTTTRVVSGLLVAAVALGFGLAGSQAQERGRESIREVEIVNWPSQWQVQGEVAIKGPVLSGRLATLRDIVVGPVGPKDVTRLVNAGSITTDGFAFMVLSLVGEVKSEHAQPGTVGAILVPDDDTVRRAMLEQGQLLMAVEVKGQTGTGRPAFFASDQQRVVVAFPRYSVYLYNTSDKGVNVALHAYLTN
jgi:hypothetical protein